MLEVCLYDLFYLVLDSPSKGQHPKTLQSDNGGVWTKIMRNNSAFDPSTTLMTRSMERWWSHGQVLTKLRSQFLSSLFIFILCSILVYDQKERTRMIEQQRFVLLVVSGKDCSLPAVVIILHNFNFITFDLKDFDCESLFREHCNIATFGKWVHDHISVAKYLKLLRIFANT